MYDSSFLQLAVAGRGTQPSVDLAEKLLPDSTLSCQLVPDRIGGYDDQQLGVRVRLDDHFPRMSSVPRQNDPTTFHNIGTI